MEEEMKKLARKLAMAMGEFNNELTYSSADQLIGLILKDELE